MSYTSNQYKYLLIKRLQRHFSMKSPRDRAYTQTFFWELFDDTVTVTEESYNNFCRLMDDEIALCAENDWYNSTSIPSAVINEQGLLLTKAFAEIGIELKITANSLGGKAEFTKPDGTVMTYINSDFYINSRAGTEYQYAKVSAPAYNMQGMDVPQELGNPKIAGPGTYWSYNADTKTVTISGEGAYAGATDETQLGSGTYHTVILGANISRLLTESFNAGSVDTIIFFAPVDAPVVLDDKILSWGTSSIKRLTVYTDNKALRDYVWPRLVRVTLHSLSEWGG
nr:MAG TPA: hypothetical protein [Caudoviricetes sp.]